MKILPFFISGVLFFLNATHLFSSQTHPGFTYPSYGEYVAFLEKWEQVFPDICKVYNLGPGGSSNLNHHIYAVRISDNVNVTEGELRYLETNTIHGDEYYHFMICLYMIDTLLTSYGKGDARIDSLVNNIDFWFIPNMNPDGTYPRGDDTVSYAQRRNVADNFDLCRNWPCPCANPDHIEYGIYDKYAKETEAVLNLHKRYTFNLMADMHSKGPEAVFWPYGSFKERSGEEEWYKWICERWVTQARKDSYIGEDYMTSCGGDGVGHCFTELYECHGMRSDYCNWYGHGKCIYPDTWNRKSPPDLQGFWETLRETLFQFYETLFTGIQGIVTDSITGKSIYNVKMNRNKGTINHPLDEYERFSAYSDSGGFYLRYTIKGTWDLTFSHDDYITKTISNITVDDYNEMIELDVQLVPKVVSILNGSLTTKPIIVTPCHNGIRISCANYYGNMQIDIIDLNGRLIKRLAAHKPGIIVWNGFDNNNKQVSEGCYIVQVRAGDKKYCRSFMFFR